MRASRQQGRLRTAVVGVGAMGQGHCRTLATQVPEMVLTAVVDAHRPTAREVGSRFGVPAFFSPEAMAKAGVADVAVIATPHPLHRDAVETCLSAGLHVLCEKPLAETISSADHMMACAKRVGRVLAVMFQRRFEPVFEAAQRFVAEGGIGELRRSLLVVAEFRTRRYFEANPWRATWKGEGGGVLVNQAPHLMDWLLLLGGMPCEVQGHTATVAHAIEVEDRADARLVYPNGAVGHLYVTTNESNIHEQLELVGTRGSLTYRRNQLECLRFDPDLRDAVDRLPDIWGKPTVCDATPAMGPEIPGNRLQGMLMSHFARHILYGEPLRCDAVSGAASLELANAIALSAYRGTPVALPLPRAEYDAFLALKRQRGTRRVARRRTKRVTDPGLG